MSEGDSNKQYDLGRVVLYHSNDGIPTIWFDKNFALGLPDDLLDVACQIECYLTALRCQLRLAAALDRTKP